MVEPLSRLWGLELLRYVNSKLAEPYFTNNEQDDELIEKREGLIRCLLDMEFKVIVGNDCNVLADGRDLRELIAFRLPYDDPSGLEPVSVFEVLAALAKKYSRELLSDSNLPVFDSWLFNLGVMPEQCGHMNVREYKGFVTVVLSAFVNRNYTEDEPMGWIFPVPKPRNWPADVDLWMQANEYCIQVDDKKLEDYTNKGMLRYPGFDF